MKTLGRLFLKVLVVVTSAYILIWLLKWMFGVSNAGDVFTFMLAVLLAAVVFGELFEAAYRIVFSDKH